MIENDATLQDKRLVGVGVGGHARILFDDTEDAGYEIIGVFHLNFISHEEYLLGQPQLIEYPYSQE